MQIRIPEHQHHIYIWTEYFDFFAGGFLLLFFLFSGIFRTRGERWERCYSKMWLRVRHHFGSQTQCRLTFSIGRIHFSIVQATSSASRSNSKVQNCQFIDRSTLISKYNSPPYPASIYQCHNQDYCAISYGTIKNMLISSADPELTEGSIYIGTDCLGKIRMRSVTLRNPEIPSPQAHRN